MITQREQTIPMWTKSLWLIAAPIIDMGLQFGCFYGIILL